MKNPWIFPAAALVVGAAGGFISGRTSSPSSSVASAEEVAQRSRSGSRTSISEEEARKSQQRVRSSEQLPRASSQFNRVRSLMDFYSSLSAEQMEDEAKKLENLPMNERMLAGFLLYGRWAEMDPMGAMAHAKTLGMASAFVMPTIMQSWASVDPENAAKYYSENPQEFANGMMGGRGPGQGGAASIASEWARQDPEAALAWATSLGKDKGQAMTAVIREVAQTDPVKAAALAATMDPSARGDAYNAIARQWAGKNFDEAQAWIRTLPADQQTAAMSSAIVGLSQTDPVKASTAISSMAAGEERDRAASTLADNWSRTDPSAAAAWLLANTSADAQTRGIGDIIQNWTIQDPKAALAQVQSLPAGDLYDEAASTYIRSNRSAAPQELVSLAETIGDERDRTRTLGMAVREWKQTDADAANAYIQQSTSIPDEMKQALIEGRGPFGGGGPPGGFRGRGR